MTEERERLFSVGRKDFDITHIKGSGSGGQHRNKRLTGVRMVHRDSGAVGQATDSKSQKTNKRNAFMRLLETDEWKNWHRVEAARAMMGRQEFERRVNTQVSKMMHPSNIREEVFDDGEWIVVE